MSTPTVVGEWTTQRRHSTTRRWQRHSVLGYRIFDYDEMRGAFAQPQAGCYVEEVLSKGPPTPVWRFD